VGKTGRHSVLNLRDRRALRLVRIRFEPRVANFFRYRLGRCAQAHHQDIGVVPFPGAAGRLRIAAQSGTDAGNLVGGDRHAGAGPAEEHALLAGARSNPLPHFPPDVDPVHGVTVQWTVQLDVEAGSAQVINHRISHRRPFVAAYRDLHALSPPTLAWFVTPFAALPFAAGYALWNVVLVASLLVTWWLTAPLASRLVRFGHLAFALALPSVAFGLLLGQVVIVVAAAVSICW